MIAMCLSPIKMNITHKCYKVGNMSLLKWMRLRPTVRIISFFFSKCKQKILSATLLRYQRKGKLSPKKFWDETVVILQREKTNEERHRRLEFLSLFIIYWYAMSRATSLKFNFRTRREGSTNNGCLTSRWTIWLENLISVSLKIYF